MVWYKSKKRAGTGYTCCTVTEEIPYKSKTINSRSEGLEKRDWKKYSILTGYHRNSVIAKMR